MRDGDIVIKMSGEPTDDLTIQIITGLVKATKLIKDTDILVKKFNEVRQLVIQEGIEYEVDTKKEYKYLGLSPIEYKKDLVTEIIETTTITAIGYTSTLLAMAGLPISISTRKRTIRDYDKKVENIGGKETIIITGYRETEYTELAVLLLPNINYFTKLELQKGGGALPYSIIPITSINTLVNIADNIFTYRIIKEVFDNNDDKTIATALFFTSHILGNRILEKFLPELGITRDEVKDILRVKHMFLSEYEIATPLTKNIFNTIASYGMVDWDLYGYIAYIADRNVGNEFTQLSMDRMKNYMMNVRYKMKAFIDNIRIIPVVIKSKDGIAKSEDLYEIGAEIHAVEQINSPFLVQDIYAGVSNPFSIISPAPILCLEPEVDDYGYPLYDVLLKDGRIITVSEPELNRYRFLTVTAKMKCKKEYDNKFDRTLYERRRITTEYTNIIAKKVRKYISRKIDLAPLTAVANEGVSINAKIDFINCITEGSISHEGINQIVIVNDVKDYI